MRADDGQTPDGLAVPSSDIAEHSVSVTRSDIVRRHPGAGRDPVSSAWLAKSLGPGVSRDDEGGMAQECPGDLSEAYVAA